MGFRIFNGADSGVPPEQRAAKIHLLLRLFVSAPFQHESSGATLVKATLIYATKPHGSREPSDCLAVMSSRVLPADTNRQLMRELLLRQLMDSPGYAESILRLTEVDAHVADGCSPEDITDAITAFKNG